MLKETNKLQRVNITMDKSLLREVDKVAKLRFEDRSTAMRQLVAVSIQEEKLGVAIRKFQEGTATFREAATIAGITYWEFQQELDKKGIPITKDYSLTVKRIGENS